jgi:putative transposase
LQWVAIKAGQKNKTAAVFFTVNPFSPWSSLVKDYERLNHTLWECKYHIVFIPKYRRKILYGVIRKELGAVFRKLAEQKESSIEEGHLMPDHVHMLLSVPPKCAVS